MELQRRLYPIGIQTFSKLREGNYLYIDKTEYVYRMTHSASNYMFLSRPRRFGKSLLTSTLHAYFEGRKDLFEGLAMEELEKEWVAYPVLHFDVSMAKHVDEARLNRMLDFLLSGYEDRYDCHIGEKDVNIRLANLIQCAYKRTGRQVVVLIDEYDVPLENAYFNGFYDKMVTFIRSLFESALKSNPSLKFAVITGCLRISKESIFTGLNNLDVISILNTVYNEHFGFTQDEVNKLLSDYHIESKSDIIKEWYDGYIFGKTEVYNPWSLINYTRAAFADESALPVEYWSNTSSNSIIKDLLSKSTDISRDEIEILVQDGSIEKTVFEDITYQDIYENEENLWNFLFFTGYLKAVEVKMKDDDRVMVLKIPNKEIKKIYRQQIVIWSRNIIKSGNLSKLFSAILKGEENILQDELAKILSVFISYMDNHEDFYHGFLLGILINMKGYKITSNREAGHGRYDLCIVNRKGTENPVIIEFKIADKKKFMENAAEKALKQIMEKGYDIPLKDDGYKECVHIGIGFCNKMCYVKCEIVKL